MTAFILTAVFSTGALVLLYFSLALLLNSEYLASLFVVFLIILIVFEIIRTVKQWWYTGL
jgi:hypothetical protein